MKATHNTKRGILAIYNSSVTLYADIQEASDDTLIEISQIRAAIARNKSINGILFAWRSEDNRGKHTNKFAKAILQLNRDGEKVAEYNSAYQANKETGVGNIYKCLNGTLKSAGGFIWKYKEV